MSNVTPLFDQALKQHGAPRSQSRLTRLSIADEFLKEAYRIVNPPLSPIQSIRNQTAKAPLLSKSASLPSPPTFAKSANPTSTLPPSLVITTTPSAQPLLHYYPQQPSPPNQAITATQKTASSSSSSASPPPKKTKSTPRPRPRCGTPMRAYDSSHKSRTFDNARSCASRRRRGGARASGAWAFGP